MHSQHVLRSTLQAIVETAQRSLAGIDHAGVSVTHRDGRIETLAATDQLVMRSSGGVTAAARLAFARRPEFWPQFFASTFENWQSEFLQLFQQESYPVVISRPRESVPIEVGALDPPFRRGAAHAGPTHAGALAP